MCTHVIAAPCFISKILLYLYSLTFLMLYFFLFYLASLVQYFAYMYLQHEVIENENKGSPHQQG